MTDRNARCRRWVISIATGWTYLRGASTVDQFSPTYCCVNPDCDEANYILCTSMSDPICDHCGMPLEEVDVSVLVSDAPPVESDPQWFSDGDVWPGQG